MGFVFVLDRDTGKPVFEVEEPAVPQDGAAGEFLSPTQPFPVAPPLLVPQMLTADDAWGLTYWDRKACRDKIAVARSEGLYTPPLAQGTIMYPFTAGGAMDNYLRAFDAASGEELWKGRLPAGGQATPMTYIWEGRQYVVIAAGGHARAGTRLGDYVKACALPE